MVELVLHTQQLGENKIGPYGYAITGVFGGTNLNLFILIMFNNSFWKI
jgi:hypothetical protein